MVKESNSSIIFFIIVVVRFLFLRKVWGFLQLVSIQSGMTYAVKIPESASDERELIKQYGELCPTILVRGEKGRKGEA